MALDTTIGGAAADSYGTLAAFEAYASTMGWTLTGGAADHNAVMRRAALYLDRNYIWIGGKATQAAARQWPRNISELVDGFAVPGNSIPMPIIYAQFELAWIAHGGTDLFATVTTGAISKAKVKVDVIEESFEYKSPKEHPLFTSIEGMIAPYHTGNRLGGGFGSIGLVR